MSRAALLSIALLCLAHAYAQELWTAPLGAKPLQAPLVADIADAPGLETVAVLESGGVRAFESDGKPLWSAELGPLAPGSQAALAPAGDKSPAYFAAPAGGAIVALTATDGQPLWKTDAILGEGTAWIAIADIDGDKSPDVIAACASGKVTAVSGIDGKVLWEYPGNDTARISQLCGPPAVADTDDDGAPELYLAGKEGVQSLDAQGHERFFAPLDAAAISAPVVGDYDDNARFEVYTVTAGGRLIGLDAAKGSPLWDLALPGEDAPTPQLVLADLEQDEKTEIVVAGKKITAVSGEGKLLASHDAPTTGIAIGDANSDGELEVVAPGTTAIDLLSPALAPVASVPLPSPAATPPVLAAINGASVLCITEDNTLRVIRTGARLMPQLSPWTAPRRDATNRGSALSPVKELDLHQDGSKLAANNASLNFAGSFEDAAQAALWKSETPGGTAAQDDQQKAAGTASLKLTPAAAELRVDSPTADAPPELRRVNASVLAKGAGARAFLAWERPGAKPVLQELRAADTTPDGWRRLRLSGAVKPAGAKTLHMVLVSPPGTPTNWDEVQATAQSLTVPYVEVFSNQLGYEVKGPKRFTAASTFSAPQAKFRVLNDQGTEVYKGNTEPPARITGAFNSDWGKFYWRGDFTPFDEPGKYKLELDVDGNTVQTTTFEIGQDLLWTRLYNKLTGAITARRCADGERCAEQHCAWNEGYTDGCRDVDHVRALNEIYSMIQWRIFDKDKPLPQLAEEIKWGADHVLAHAEGESHVAEAIAGVARIFPKETKYADFARQLLLPEHVGRDMPLNRFCALLDLYVATHDDSLVEELKKLYPGPEIKAPESVIRYESEVDEMAMVSFDLGKKLSEHADVLLKQAQNPFGVCGYAADSSPNYFGGEKPGADSVMPGNTRHVLEAARDVAQAYRFNSKTEYLQFIMDQFNWVLGNNPFGMCLMEGVGVKNLPAYTYPDPKFPRGVPIGAIAEGIHGLNGDDRPLLDAGSNAAPLWNTIAFLDALANLKRIHMAGAQKAQP